MIDLGAAAITERLRRASAESDLGTERRLAPKLDMSARGVTARLRQVEALRRLCLALGAIGSAARGAPRLDGAAASGGDGPGSDP
jgi:hypothetical protein